MSFRMGITIGDVVERDGDLLGEGVNIAARLESVAPVGGICVSGPVYEAVQNKLSVRFDDMGQQQLKNIPNRIHAFALDLHTDELDGKGKPLSKFAFPARPMMVAIAAAALLAGGISFFAIRSLWGTGDNGVALEKPQSGAASQPPKDLTSRSDKLPVAASAGASPQPPAAAQAAQPPDMNGPAQSADAGAGSNDASSASGAATSGALSQATNDTPTPRSDESLAKSDKAPTASEPPSLTDRPADSSSSGEAHGSGPDADTEKSTGDHIATLEKPAGKWSGSDRIAQDTVLRRLWQRCSNDDKHETYDEAIAACEKLLDNHWVADADAGTALLNKGRALRQLGRFDEAISIYTDAIKHQSSAAAYNQRGAVYYDQRQWDEAISDFGKAISLESDNGEYRNNRAWTLYKSGRLNDALTDANAAVATLDGVAYPWDTRAHIHEALGNRAAALEDYKKAISIDPALKTSRDGLIRLGSRP